MSIARECALRMGSAEKNNQEARDGRESDPTRDRDRGLAHGDAETYQPKISLFESAACGVLLVVEFLDNSVLPRCVPHRMT